MKQGNRILNILVVITTTILILGLIILGFQVFSSTETSRFTENVVINGVNVKGLNKTQAQTKVNSALQNKIDNLQIRLTYKDKEWNYNSSDFKVNSEIFTIIDEAYKYTQMDKKSDVLKLISTGGYNFDIAFNHVFIDFKDKVELIKQEIEQPFVNSEVEFLPDSKELFKISKSQNGRVLDEESLYAEIEKQFKETSNIEIELATKVVSPEISESFYSDKLELLGEFSTDLSTSKGGRKHNVDLALTKFNGKVINSKENISFNEITGPHSYENGYQSAIVIVNGEFVEGVGGGVCQASTTLYNALLLSGVEINEVHKHTLPVGYVELSLDAMVSEGWADLKFTNLSEYPIYVKAFVEGDKACVKIFGKPLEEGVTYKRSVEYVRTIPHGGDKIIKDEKGEYSDKVTYEGEYFRLSYPKEGYEAKGYLEKYKDNELINKVMIRHEIYEPKNGLLIEGTKPPKNVEDLNNSAEIIPPQIEVETAVEITINSLTQYNP